MASAAVGGLMILGTPALLLAQYRATLPHPVGRVASLAPGAIHGVVKDDRGTPVTGAIISALGVTTTFAFTDREGRFELEGLPPGPYLLRAYSKGYHAPRSEMVQVRSSGRTLSSIAMRRAEASPTILGAGVVGGSEPVEQVVPVEPGPDEGRPSGRGDTEEVRWRLRHTRRSVLKTTTMFGEWLADGWTNSADLFGSADLIGRAVAAPARVATNFFAETPFSGQVNLLTASSFERPEQLFSPGSFSRGIARIAHVSVGAPVGDQGDWAISGALTQADISAWIVAGSYATRAPAAHRYDVGLSYSTQRYLGGNPLALRGVADVTRNAGALHGFDTFTVSPALTLTYGARYARYDYLAHRALVSPRVTATLKPADGLRMGVMLSRSAHAPGAEEFLPPGDTGIWLPPQRTFSSLKPARPLEAERATQLAVEVEHDIAGSTIAVRAFRQQVADQLLTLFGLDLPEQPVATLGHYFVGNAGSVRTAGGVAEFRTGWAGRIKGSISYSLVQAELDPASDLHYVFLLTNAAPPPEVERIHDVATTIQADVPETSTRVLVVYRASNAFAERATDAGDEGGSGLDYRFDVQVRQALPFMSFSNAKWEMLLAVRNFFREAVDDQSFYGELLVIRPPKRIVGGVTLHF
jgi:hypothetical protein